MKANRPALPETGWSEEQLQGFHRLYALRSLLAGFAARQAAARVAEGASPAALGEAYTQMHLTARAQNYSEFLDADMRFHQAIAELAGTPAMPQVWAQLEHEMKSFAGWAHREMYHDLEMIAASHAPQWEAIARGLPDAAEHASHVNLDSLWHMLKEQPTVTHAEPDPVERACAFILLNLHRKITLEYVAREVAHLSASHFNKLFRQSRGEPFGVHVQKLRLRRAESLLREGGQDIRNIAARVGYADTSRFSEHFKRQYGCLPSDYARHIAARK